MYHICVMVRKEKGPAGTGESRPAACFSAVNGKGHYFVDKFPAPR